MINDINPENDKSNPENNVYIIPLAYRRMENLHIVFWLLKDIGWCLIWKPLGLAMIAPTFVISVLITYRTRQLVSELCHNMAISLWIMANSYWMISEFAGFDTHIVAGTITFKQLALIPFLSGVLILAYYYVIWLPTHPNEVETL